MKKNNLDIELLDDVEDEIFSEEDLEEVMDDELESELDILILIPTEIYFVA